MFFSLREKSSSLQGEFSFSMFLRTRFLSYYLLFLRHPSLLLRQASPFCQPRWSKVVHLLSQVTSFRFFSVQLLFVCVFNLSLLDVFFFFHITANALFPSFFENESGFTPLYPRLSNIKYFISLTRGAASFRPPYFYLRNPLVPPGFVLSDANAALCMTL